MGNKRATDGTESIRTQTSASPAAEPNAEPRRAPPNSRRGLRNRRSQVRILSGALRFLALAGVLWFREVSKVSRAFPKSPSPNGSGCDIARATTPTSCTTSIYGGLPLVVSLLAELIRLGSAQQELATSISTRFRRASARSRSRSSAGYRHNGHSVSGDLPAGATRGRDELSLLVVMRIVCLLAAAVLIGYPVGADAVRSGGHNPPTRKLEVAFKVAGGVRDGSNDGCYAASRRMAALIHHWGHLEAEVARGFGGVTRPDVVYVIASRSSCERMVFALRDRGKLFVLDTAAGDVYPRGQAADRRRRRGAPSGTRPSPGA